MNITPQMLQNSCDYSVKMVSQLPQDDAANWQVARTAKETGLLSDDDIRDNILKLQDSQQAADKIRAQKAKELLRNLRLRTTVRVGSLLVRPGPAGVGRTPQGDS